MLSLTYGLFFFNACFSLSFIDTPSNIHDRPPIFMFLLTKLYQKKKCYIKFSML